MTPFLFDLDRTLVDVKSFTDYRLALSDVESIIGTWVDPLAARAAGCGFIGLTNGGPSQLAPDTVTILSLESRLRSLRNNRD